MVRQKKKYESGSATAFISRKSAQKKLQLGLRDFRRLCIIKGIYPIEPRHKKKVGRGSTKPKIYYLLKDIQFLMHEPIIGKFRDYRAHLRKVKRARGKNDNGRLRRLLENKPKYTLHHVVKERYPSFTDAIRDLDDCMSMCCLFALFPKTKSSHPAKIHLCRRLSVELAHYVIASKSLRKVFVSIKGFYYQAEIQGQKITWIVPHKFGHDHSADVDYRIMSTFVEFYTTMLGFVNLKLYNMMGLVYPPKLQLPAGSSNENLCDKFEVQEELLSAMTQTLEAKNQDVEEDVQIDEFPADDPDQVEETKVEQDRLKRLQNLFHGLKLFLNREVPRESLTFVIRSLGGQVSWCKTLGIGATYEEADESITHHIVDRPALSTQYLSRYYIQPQWVYDSVNAAKLLPVEDYFIGVTLPPHLSPFASEGPGEYVPPEGLREMETDSGVDEEGKSDSDNEAAAAADDDDDDDTEDSSEEESGDDESEISARKSTSKSKAESEEPQKHSMEVRAGSVEKIDVAHKAKHQINEERRLAELMIPKKKKRLYSKIMYSRKKKSQEVKKLEEKRAAIDAKKKKVPTATLR